MSKKINPIMFPGLLSTDDLLRAQFGEHHRVLSLKEKTRLRIVRAMHRYALDEKLGEVTEIRSGSEVLWSKKESS